jgi:hypothetical protein
MAGAFVLFQLLANKSLHRVWGIPGAFALW